MPPQPHNGKSRPIASRARGKPPETIRKVPFFSERNFPLIRKMLVQAAKGCRFRQFTGKFSTAPCCRAENGQVFACLQYGHEPAKLYDCIKCRKQDAIERGEAWIAPLVQLSSGSESPPSSHEAVRAAGFYDALVTGSSDAAPPDSAPATPVARNRRNGV